ncbi:hypothetical protein LCGC14_0768520 [marine sediment metagenome]|uniref:Uncharacterized protein n=1 Tax=marine sediment metagenome TaxID=412755 RepID=A0A0F9Q360_9ZZZZ
MANTPEEIVREQIAHPHKRTPYAFGVALGNAIAAPDDAMMVELERYMKDPTPENRKRLFVSMMAAGFTDENIIGCWDEDIPTIQELQELRG